MSGTFILTSDGLTNKVLVNAVIAAAGSGLSKQKAAIITTASKGKETNPYSQKAREQYLEMDFGEVLFVDLETEPKFAFDKFHLIHVCGGNTFKLLHFARQANFKQTIEKLIARGGVYVGVSAGVNIVMPSVHIVEEYQLDSNLIGLKDFTGFNLVPMNIFVHYAPEWEPVVGGYEKKYGLQFVRITDDQAIVFREGQMEIITG
ncbi:MAG: Type 1 glutamine amidotransferase-like domain-containing protein [Candidatus Vogelbacteria bacterium]|nr:Type 1 glutamine amidotransferase-like domain-containing protein [Candidatus Vogelbacteria bacterium]